MSKNVPALMSVEQFTTHQAAEATLAVMRVVDKYEAQVGRGSGEQLIIAFTKCYVQSAVFAVLNRAHKRACKDGREATPEDADEALKAYQTFKTDLQNALGAAFGDALFQFSGRNTDFYCQIKPVPEPVNSEPC